MVAYVNWSAGLVALVPPGPVTVMSTVPVPAGLAALICVTDVTVKLAAGAPPNLTAVAPVNPVPVIVTVVPPVGGPVAGVMDVTVGAGCVVTVRLTGVV